jgi:hypothetical protein
MFRKVSEDNSQPPPRISFLMEKNGKKPAILESSAFKTPDSDLTSGFNFKR